MPPLQAVMVHVAVGYWELGKDDCIRAFRLPLVHSITPDCLWGRVPVSLNIRPVL